MSGVKRTNLRAEVLKADPEYSTEDKNPVEYEFSEKRKFRGRYQNRGAYTTTE